MSSTQPAAPAHSAMWTKPAPGTLKFASLLLIAILIPSTLITTFAGTVAGMAFGIATGLTLAVTPYASTRAALGSAVLAAILGGAASAAEDHPLIIASLMLVSGLLLAATNRHSAGLMTLAPVIVILFGPARLNTTWQEVFFYLLIGGIFGWILTRVFKISEQPRPVPSDVAWRHGITLGVLAAATMYWALANNISHGYWVTVTLVMALRPLPEERSDTLRNRLLGTAMGAILAFLVIAFLPTPVAFLVAAVCLLLLAAYSMSGNYFLQTAFLTPMLLIFSSLGNKTEGLTDTVERVWYTLVGVAVGGLAAWFLSRWDAHSYKKAAAKKDSVSVSDGGATDPS